MRCCLKATREDWRLRPLLSLQGWSMCSNSCHPRSHVGEPRGANNPTFSFQFNQFPRCKIYQISHLYSYKYRKHYINAISTGFWSTSPSPSPSFLDSFSQLFLHVLLLFFDALKLIGFLWQKIKIWAKDINGRFHTLQTKWKRGNLNSTLQRACKLEFKSLSFISFNFISNKS